MILTEGKNKFLWRRDFGLSCTNILPTLQLLTLYDASQKIGKDLGASVTPEFFVYGKDRKLVYMGSFDDKQNDPKVNFLEEAVKSALEGKKIEKAETRPFGCGGKDDSK